MGLVATTEEQKDCQSARDPSTPQVLTRAGQAARASSLRQPGRRLQLTGSKLAVGAVVLVDLGWCMQAASASAQRSREILVSISHGVQADGGVPGSGAGPASNLTI